MTTLTKEFGYMLLMFMPVGAILLYFYRASRKEKAAAVAPFTELQRRPAGESNRLRVEEFDERIDPWLVVLTTIPILLALSLTLLKPSWAVVITFFLISAIVSAVAQRVLSPLIRKRAAYRLGFHGERYVAEELNQLMADGFHVFHDVPFGNYNMDHVLVGPTGVFVIETKAKRKPVTRGEKKYQVVFDGKTLQFPHGQDTAALDQVERNKQTLSKWLSSATADQIKAEGIVTIPGWYVERTGQSNISILNPKEIRTKIITDNRSPLTPEQIQRACHQLEEKCKLPVS